MNAFFAFVDVISWVMLAVFIISDIVLVWLGKTWDRHQVTRRQEFVYLYLFYAATLSGFTLGLTMIVAAWHSITTNQLVTGLFGLFVWITGDWLMVLMASHFVEVRDKVRGL